MAKISISKIDDTIQEYKFRNELRNENGDIISNFIQLRNFFVHHLGSKEAERFLQDSEMLFNLKLTITILILYRLGITEIKFKSYFLNLSVFDDCLTGEKWNTESPRCIIAAWVAYIVYSKNVL